MRRRAKRRSERRQQRGLSLRERVVKFVRELFSSGPPHQAWDEDSEGGLGVREPRRPLHPSLSGAVALEAPSEERRDVWAVGEENRG